MGGCRSFWLVQHTQMGTLSGRRTGAKGTVTNTDSQRSRTWVVGWVFQFGMVHEMEAPAVFIGAGISSWIMQVSRASGSPRRVVEIDSQWD
jgi:hypothetical protein